MTLHHKQLAGASNVHPTAFLAGLMDLHAGLTRTELDGIAAALGPRWCMVPHQDLGGEAMAMVMETTPAQPMPSPAQPMPSPAQPMPSPAQPMPSLAQPPYLPAQPPHGPAQPTNPRGHQSAPTWIVHREGALLRLDVCDGETYTRLGAYSALAPLLASLRTATEAAGKH